MKLICSNCGNYVHFETEVEMHQPIRIGNNGLRVEPRDADGYDHRAASVRMGVEDMVNYCVHNDMQTLVLSVNGDAAKNMNITCARCGSSAVSIPYCPWSPPNTFETMEEEITANRKEYTWLRKEREQNEANLPIVRR